MTSYKRDDIKSGDLLVWSRAPHGGFWLKLVRLMTVSDYGHLSIAWKIGDSLNHIEAVMPRIHAVPVPTDASFYVIPMSGIITDADNMEPMKEALGKRYSIVDAIRGYLGIQVENNDAWQCVELSDHYFQSKGVTVKSRFLTPSRYVKKLMGLTGLGLFRVESSPRTIKESDDG